MMTIQPQLPKVEINEISLFYYSYNYYWFKIFSRFWLVKTARIIHHNQFCWTNLERIFHIEPMTKSAAGYRLLNWWRQNDVKSAARYRLLNRRPKNLRMRFKCGSRILKWGVNFYNNVREIKYYFNILRIRKKRKKEAQKKGGENSPISPPLDPRLRLCYFWKAEKQRAHFLRVRKYFEWILQIAERVIHLGLQPRWITPSLICKILHNLRKPNSIIGNYLFFQRGREVSKRPRSSMKHRSVREEGERRKYRNG